MGTIVSKVPLDASQTSKTQARVATGRADSATTALMQTRFVSVKADGPTSDQILARVAQKLPRQHWFKIGICFLKLSSLQLNNCDATSENYFRSVFCTLQKWYISEKQKRMEERQSKVLTMGEQGKKVTFERNILCFPTI